MYLFHDYLNFIEIDLKNELEKGNYNVMIPELFSEQTVGHQHYQKYNDVENPTLFLEELVESAGEVSEEELQEMGFNDILNMIGNEWIKDKKMPEVAIKIFTYSTQLLPNDADIFDSLGEAYFEDKNYEQALMNYKKSLRLNSENENAKEFVAKINKLIEEE